MIDPSEKMYHEYFERSFENVVGFKLISANKNVYGKLVLTFEGEDGITIDKHIAGTAMGGVNIKEV